MFICIVHLQGRLIRGAFNFISLMIITCLCKTWYCLWSALQDPQSDERFHVELHFSPGAYCVGQNKEYPAGRGYRPQHGEKKQV